MSLYLSLYYVQSQKSEALRNAALQVINIRGRGLQPENVTGLFEIKFYDFTIQYNTPFNPAVLLQTYAAEDVEHQLLQRSLYEIRILRNNNLCFHSTWSRANCDLTSRQSSYGLLWDERFLRLVGQAFPAMSVAEAKGIEDRIKRTMFRRGAVFAIKQFGCRVQVINRTGRALGSLLHVSYDSLSWTAAV